MTDSVLSLWLRLLALNLEGERDPAHPLAVLRDEWLWQSEVASVGFMDARLDQVASEPATKASVVAAIERLLDELSRHHGKLAGPTLNLLGFRGVSWTGDFEAKDLIEVGNAFLALIAGKIDSEANSTEFMPGCR
ncbi:hypothetical protein DPM33_07030 [Mesorhizobium hawassense]|uniref:Uncharacterized protein n=2 Tax=Mesorhizobium hawassense TaxID=1209954 RepID=A0A330HUU7_9HYPH|nr:hypothetical protein DPM33_07030 [Mesorhizobium hawassense]